MVLGCWMRMCKKYKKERKKKNENTQNAIKLAFQAAPLIPALQYPKGVWTPWSKATPRKWGSGWREPRTRGLVGRGATRSTQSSSPPDPVHIQSRQPYFNNRKHIHLICFEKSKRRIREENQKRNRNRNRKRRFTRNTAQPLGWEGGRKRRWQGLEWQYHQDPGCSLTPHPDWGRSTWREVRVWRPLTTYPGSWPWPHATLDWRLFSGPRKPSHSLQRIAWSRTPVGLLMCGFGGLSFSCWTPNN